MKKIIFLMFFFLGIGLSFAGWEEVINQQEEQAQMDKIKVLNEKFKLEKFKTNQDFEAFLLNKLYPKVVDFCKNYNQYPPYILYRTNLKTEAITITKGIDDVSANVSYGKTNLQKENVDEPEILKLTKDYIAYYNKSQNKVYIISSPIDNTKLNLSKVKITDKIQVPFVIRSYSVKLFFQNNQLIIMGTRYSKYFNGEVTDVVFYKINDGKAKFLRLYDVKGSFKDARITNNKLYLITSYNFSNFVRNICDDIDLPKQVGYQDDNQMIGKKIKSRGCLDEKNCNLVKKLEGYLNQKSIDIVYNRSSKLKIGKTTYPLDIKVVSSSLNNILFLPTNFDKLNLYGLKFNVVNVVDLDTKVIPNQYIIFGNMQNGIIHMTTKSLYLINNYYESTSWRCRPNIRCILPYFPRGNFTLIHKLKLIGSKLDYVNSQIVPGRPINQYSMDEDDNGNFRIFTKFYFPKRATDLFVFDSNLRLVGKLLNIAPGEDFKSSRFIQDKAYLVTFKATDPLFVIDLSNLSTPKIIGELKIPGYSLYLHPLREKLMNNSDESRGNVQYLLGVGQEAKEVHGNWSLPRNIKIDVYKIDFSKKSGDMIQVEQLFTTVLGKETKYKNGGSYTPVFDNPRTFVMIGGQKSGFEVGRESEEVRRDLRSEERVGGLKRFDKSGVNPMNNNLMILLPVYLTKDEVIKRCYETYIWKDGKKHVQEEKCYDYVEKVPYFVGVKGLKINLEKGFKEVVSKNYLDLYKKAGLHLTQRSYKNENHRVSYYRQGNDTAILEINTNFANLFDKGYDKYLFFDSKFTRK